MSRKHEDESKRRFPATIRNIEANLQSSKVFRLLNL